MSETAYDSVPYPGHVHTHTHPNRVAAVARLFGLDAPPVATARILEIGCGDGGNLIPIAYTLPQARCLGFDLAETAVGRARHHIAALGLANCEVIVADLATADGSLGQFDYVIAHGVYSWVPAGLREALLQLVARVLSPNGVAFVSYNVFPGWRIAGMVREMLRYHTQGIADAGTRVEQAKALLKFVAAAHEADDPYGRLLAAECERVSGYPGWYLHHDDLADINDPVYFHEFVAQAGRFGLSYLAEADFATMTGAELPAAARDKLDEVSSDPVLRGQYLDFIQCRRFRQSLLTHAAQPAAPGPLPERVRTLFVASAATPDVETVDLAAGVEVQFRWGQRSSLKTDHPLAKAALLVLNERWPEAVGFDELRAAIAQRYGIGPDDAASTLEGILLTAFGLRMVELTDRPWRAVSTPAERPEASRVARLEAESSEILTSLMHRRVRIDGTLALRLLPLCDGTRSREALAAALARAEAPVSSEEIGQLLRGWTRLGVLEG